MADAFVRTIKRDNARVSHLPDVRTVIKSLPVWFDHYTVHPHSALRSRSPREFIAAQSNREAVSGI
jgi:putative transposase